MSWDRGHSAKRRTGGRELYASWISSWTWTEKIFRGLECALTHPSFKGHADDRPDKSMSHGISCRLDRSGRNFPVPLVLMTCFQAPHRLIFS